ncbi:MAG TPA: UbiA family prenyltransferase [Anaerovoracaceae bacterium]|nr:UbiA family prenyltransferase [Anaerovoracaceae bacterium]
MIAGLLRYVEIKTKITSVFPFMMILGYLLYKGQTIDIRRTLIFFVGMFIFDLTTTAINNYIDTKTNEQILPVNRQKALAIIFMLFAISLTFGVWLVLLTDIVVLIIGGICFICGVLYTYGPIPISRQPLGEIVSGIFYGLLIPFILLYINMPQGYFLSYELSINVIEVKFYVMPIVTILILSVNPVCCTANIMLANNICDLEKDVKVNRFTLPYYLKEKALILFAWLYYITYPATALMVALKILHPLCLLSILTIIPVHKNVKIFLLKQDKDTTFLTSIKNYVIIMGSLTLTIFIGSLMN